jgi:ABC-type multidrug transport system fused ATPase/permease subunit
MDALDRLMTGRTTFIIAHRLSTLEKCDMTLTLDHGRLLTPHQDGAALAVTA